MSLPDKNWHQKHTDELRVGDRIADAVAGGMGSWRFIIIQSIIVALWMIANTIGFIAHWDLYPFILLNLLFSTQAAYAAPIIMMSQNRAAQRDKAEAEHQYEHNDRMLAENTALTREVHALTTVNTELLKQVSVLTKPAVTE